jgi:hypothetical protein
MICIEFELMALIMNYFLGTDVSKKQEQLVAITKALDDLFAGQFVSVAERRCVCL